MKHVRILPKADLRSSGLGFAVLHQARKNGISGYMHYESNGFPVIDAQAESDRIDRFILWCREQLNGIEMAVEESPVQIMGEFRLTDPGNFS